MNGFLLSLHHSNTHVEIHFEDGMTVQLLNFSEKEIFHFFFFVKNVTCHVCGVRK